jgi:hypothetical protein
MRPFLSSLRCQVPSAQTYTVCHTFGSTASGGLPNETIPSAFRPANGPHRGRHALPLCSVFEHGPFGLEHGLPCDLYSVESEEKALIVCIILFLRRFKSCSQRVTMYSIIRPQFCLSPQFQTMSSAPGRRLCLVAHSASSPIQPHQPPIATDFTGWVATDSVPYHIHCFACLT